ncbi:MAG TPA: hypothetical protein VMV05_00670 [bacterium]|nr:hypothetical protein [bacterium]
MRKRFKFYFVPAVLVLLPLADRSAWGEGGNPNDYLHTRTYVGVVGTSVSVGQGGIFNGTHYSRIDAPLYEIDLLPGIAQNFGFGVLVGHREEAYAMDVSYWQSNHVASFGPVTTGSNYGGSATLSHEAQDTAVYRSVNIDFKRYFLTESQLQPFVNLGVCLPWIVVDNASEDSNGDIGAVTLAGLGLNLGIGAEYYLSPNISFVGAAFQRWSSFDQLKGFGTQFYPIAQYQNGSDEADGLVFELGTTIGFQ